MAIMEFARIAIYRSQEWQQRDGTWAEEQPKTLGKWRKRFDAQLITAGAVRDLGTSLGGVEALVYVADEGIARLNKLAEDGWDVISLNPTVWDKRTNYFEAWLRRTRG